MKSSVLLRCIRASAEALQQVQERRHDAATFLRELVARGFRASNGLFVGLDGANGRRAVVQDAFGDVPVQRSRWRKRENVVRHLPKGQQVIWRRTLQDAYAHATYGEAKRALHTLAKN